MGVIGDNLQAVRARIAAAEIAAGRDPASAGLLAVSKTFGAEAVLAARAAGQRAFGESYVQEAVEKIATVADPGIEWHFIGPLQSNKTRLVAEHFDWVHSVSSLRIARRLSEQRPASRGPMSICLQVNVSGEASKAGVSEAELPALASAVATLPSLRLRGLMCIPAPAEGFAAQRAPFAELARMLQRLRGAGMDVDTLSMGMSDDLEAAIAEGATWVRVGTAIFGSRTGAAPSAAGGA
ncbi:MAG: YggS family pyridoxal phosphate-dependent enzyme [Proteobacteria bacterium]|nr:YggS family pyridoxal phosphate-dependent enzyme [Pseudomonadota bacterium]